MKSPHGREMPVMGGPCLIMGILNLTPDSFSDGGKFFEPAAAISHVRRMIEDGADIIDMGAESTKPGAQKVSAQTEIDRLIPILREVRKMNPAIPISVDTYKPEVAEAAIVEGADIINDVYSILDKDGFFPMAKLAAKLEAMLVVTHDMRGTQLSDAEEQKDMGKFEKIFLSEIGRKLEAAISEGLDGDSIILDPGFGFGKTPAQNFELVKNLKELFGRPVLLGASKKSSLKSLVGGNDDDLQLATSAISAIVAFEKSAQILRVHNVKETALILKVAEKLEQSRKWTR